MAVPDQELTLTFRLLINWFLLVFKILSYSGFLAWAWTCCFDWVTVFDWVTQAVANPCLDWNYLPSSFFFFDLSFLIFFLSPDSPFLPPSLPSYLSPFLSFHQHSIHFLKFHFSYQTSLTLLTSDDFLLSDHWIVLGTTYVVLFVSSRLFSCSSFYLWFRAVHMVIMQIGSYLADPILSCLLYSSLVTMWPIPESLHSANWR